MVMSGGCVLFLSYGIDRCSRLGCIVRIMRLMFFGSVVGGG